jgi:O-6-methylguanine DNA methyltransferase
MKVKTGHTSITDQDVYALLSKIPPGKVSTYGDIAKALGHPKAARAIGRIIANNPNPILVHVTGLSNQMARLVVLHMASKGKDRYLKRKVLNSKIEL